MYFPVGWPKYLSVGQGRKSCLKCVVCNRYRMLFAVLTETTISIWHCRPCVEIVCYQRRHSSVASVGNNDLAEWRQDSSMLAITTTEGYLLLYQLEQDVKGDKGLNLYEYHQTKANQGDSNEAVPALRLILKANVNYKCPITSLSCVHDELLVTLKDGRLELLSWESPTNGRKSIGLCEILFSVDMQLAGLHLKTRHVYPTHATYSPFLEGFAVVLSDGRAALVALAQSDAKGDSDSDGSHSEAAAWNAKGIWAPGLTQATCVAVNNKYRLLAFGTEKGDCCVYALDDMTGCLVLSHTIALSSTHYPNICNSVGSVLNVDWSPDGCALSLSWASGGLSVWSVFGACLVCTLASDRAHASDGSLNIQGIFRSMCWGVEGYQLWLISESPPSSISTSSSDKTESDPDDKSVLDPDVLIRPTESKTKKHFKRFRKKSSSSHQANSVHDSHNLALGQLLQVQFAKSALAMNPCMSNHCHVLLHSEDRIYLSSGERPVKSLTSANTSETQNSIKKQVTSNQMNTENSPMSNHLGNISPRRRSVPASFVAEFQTNHLPGEKLVSVAEEKITKELEAEEYVGSPVGNKQWTVIQFPINYLPSNWPIRFAAVDESCSYITIAGNFGLAHYSVLSRKWKVFGNVMQEKDMVVTGGLTWWEDFIVVACFSLSDNQDEIRLYPRQTNLDNAFACISKVRSQILLVNVFQNLLILFTYDYRISIFVIARNPKMPTAMLRFLQDVSMERYVPYPTLVASVTMSALHMESAMRRSSSSASLSSRPSRETEVIIVNVAGRLLLLQRSMEDDDAPGGADEEDLINSLDDDHRKRRFTSPVVLASCVENIWTNRHKNSRKVHLSDALWLGCGSAGVRVWLPLFPPRESRHSSSDGASQRGLELQLLTARRITLAFSLDSCYPLAVLFNEAVILGVTSEMLLYEGFDQKSVGKRNQINHGSLPFSTIERTCEIYLHQILRQLLRRNLGYHALQLAATCNNLSCFPHVLELMLHEVLEEEATASEPIPDPLLPTVIKFLQTFPEYLQTVVHCARKTEIALWEYLFNSVGSPRELFEECLENNQLQTAASYLIILQNLEQLAVARQDATKLFDQALQNHMWELANDIARFLRAIGDGDASATPRHPTLLNSNIYPAVAPAAIHNTPTEPEPSFKFSEERKKSLVMRQYSMAPSYYEKAIGPSNNALGKDGTTSTIKRKISSSRSCPSTPAVVVTFPGYNTSTSKMQGSSPNSTEEPGSTPTNHSNRRISTRSYTESYLLPTKSPASSTTVTSPTGQSSVGSSTSQPFISRYSMRQYHQEHHPMHRPLQHSVSHPMSNSGRPKRLSGDKEMLHSKEHAAAECAEHYFIDVILARQARKMLSDIQLHKLGTFAAYVDFQLVPWLRKERNRAAKVEDAVTCFRALHIDFDWPYPAFFGSRTGRSSSGGTPAHSHSYNDLATLQNRAGMSNLATMSPSRSTNFNSSASSSNRNLGLRSFNRNGLSPRRASPLLDNSGFGTDEDGGSGVLTVLSARETGSTLTLATVASEMSEVSETSYTFDDSSFGATTEDVHGFMTSGIEVDDKRGPARSEMKLQYLLELFLEALCLEWAVLICVMLKDPSYMARLVRSAGSFDHTWSGDDTTFLETLQRTRDCLQQIDQWSITECPGYKAVLINMRGHLHSLYDIITAREVSHAENQAIIAKQQLSGVNSASQSTNSSIASGGERNAKSTHASTTVTTTSTSPQSSAQTTVVKRRLFVPGTAVAHSDILKEEAVNGVARSASSENDDGDLNVERNSSLKFRDLPESHRTRHNSVPCKNTSADVNSLSEAVHTRTPSSPAKITFRNQTHDEHSTSEVQVNGAETLSVAATSDAESGGPSRSRSTSRSENTEDDESIYSASDDALEDEQSGCAIS